MWRKMRTQCMYLVLLVILGISFTSCSAHNLVSLAGQKFRTSWFSRGGSSAESLGEDQTNGHYQNGGDGKLGAMQSKKDDSSKPKSIGAAVVSGQKKPLLDHYQELLVQIKEDEEVISQLKEKQGELGTTVENLKTEIDVSKVKLKEEELKSLDLYEKNEELVIKYKNDSNALKAKEKGYVDEIEELKMQLIRFQINEVKSKQELVRVRTQHVMDKKRWTQ